MRFSFILLIVCTGSMLAGQSTVDATWARVQTLFNNVKTLEQELEPLREADKDKAYLMTKERELEDEYNALEAAYAAYRANTFGGLNQLAKQELDDKGEGAIRSFNENVVGEQKVKDYTGFLVKYEGFTYLCPGPIQVEFVLNDVYYRYFNPKLQARLVIEDENLLYGGRVYLKSSQVSDRNDMKIVEHKLKPVDNLSGSFPTSYNTSVTVDWKESSEADAVWSKYRTAVNRQRQCRRDDFGCPSREELQNDIDAAADEAIALIPNKLRLMAEVEATEYFREAWKKRIVRIDGYLTLEEWSGDFYFQFNDWALRNLD